MMTGAPISAVMALSGSDTSSPGPRAIKSELSESRAPTRIEAGMNEVVVGLRKKLAAAGLGQPAELLEHLG